MKNRKPEADFLIEVSYEICNKVGGIYRVLESKADQMTEKYGEDYYLIGPYNLDKNKGEFKQEAPPEELQKIFDEIEKEGLKCYFGRWLVKGRPKTILIDYQDYFSELNKIKKELWDRYGVDSLNSGRGFDDPVVWSRGVGKLIEKLNNKFLKGEGIAHFHEWLSGPGLLYLRENTEISTVFTTHATSLGRTLADNGIPLYKDIEEIEADEEAYNFEVNAKHQLERETAQKANVLTTVSKITGMETTNFLKRKPDVLLPNGLDLEKYLTFEEIVIKHRRQRRRLREFIIPFFFPYYELEIENTLFYFIVGRYEHRVKGVDVFIKALSRLNEKLKNNPENDKTIVTFFWLPAEVRSVNRQLTENQQYFDDLKDTFEGALPRVEERLLYQLLYDEETTTGDLIEENKLRELEKKLMRMERKEDKPPLCTHELKEGENKVIKELKEHGLTNKKEDPVKVIYYPVYLTGHDGLSNLNYNEAIEACHLGVFPSYYEPWGYTPLEAAALGVASVTTDLAGFGRYRQNLQLKDGKEGVYVLERHHRSDGEAIEDLADHMHKFADFNRQGRVDNKIESRKIAAEADWVKFVNRYVKAHNQAL